MLGAVQVQLYSPSQASADHIRDAIVNYVAGLPAASVWKLDQPRDLPKGAQWIVFAGLWYADPAQAQAVFNQVQTLWNSGQYRNDVLSGSIVRWHECREDEYDGTPATSTLLDCSDPALDARGQAHGLAVKP